MRKILCSLIGLLLMQTPALADIATIDDNKPAQTDVASMLPVYLRETRAKINEIVPVVNQLNAGNPVITVTTTPYSITSNYSGYFYNNTRASKTVTLVLPEATSGLFFGIVRTAARTLRIKPGDTDVISTGGAGKYLELTSTGSYVVLYCGEAGKWSIIHADGSYVMET